MGFWKGVGRAVLDKASDQVNKLIPASEPKTHLKAGCAWCKYEQEVCRVCGKPMSEPRRTVEELPENHKEFHSAKKGTINIVASKHRCNECKKK
jgi:hypothetical protein